MNDIIVMAVAYLLLGGLITAGIFHMVIEGSRRGIDDGRYTEPHENLGLLIYKKKIRIGRTLYLLTAVMLSILISPALFFIFMLVAP